MKISNIHDFFGGGENFTKLPDILENIVYQGSMSQNVDIYPIYGNISIYVTQSRKISQILT